MIGLVVSLLIALVGLLGLGVLVGLALMGTGILMMAGFRDADVAAFLAGDIWRGLVAPELAALPLFILMGELLHKGRLAEQVFAALDPLMRRVPGGLMHVNVLGCTLFAAVSGSSAATTATIGRITLPALEERGLDRDLALGSLCGAGTLGFLIPPSLILILYGVLSDTSILDLFIAGLGPGLMLAALYMAFIAVRASGAGSRAGRERLSLPVLKALIKLGPMLALITTVIGSMYLGFAGPTEAATVGVAGALMLAWLSGGLSVEALTAALMAAVRTSAMIGLIVAGAFFLSKAMALFGIPQAVVATVADLHLPPVGLILVLLVIYALLGMILDGLSIIVMTLPIALPLVIAAGFSPVWFGIFLVVVVEMSQITPPIGFNLFVVQGLTGEPIGRIARASLPFFAILAGFALLITLVPEIVLWPL